MAILLVEDDEFVCDVAVATLAKHGLSVTCVPSGEAAVSLIGSGETFDLLITDIQLPGRYDGYATAVEFRKLWPNMPVIYITASHRQQNPVVGSVYLRKPIKPALLMSIVGAFLPVKVKTEFQPLAAPSEWLGQPNYLH
ncbi:response regulator [Microvirga massiliensis]|uniref:response regulator n=1 Tax=Microvirga massiliensis TaxID=1033741 RepID=UPI0006615CF2|nr:response regulator [Microvirga massiliensis]